MMMRKLIYAISVSMSGLLLRTQRIMGVGIHGAFLRRYNLSIKTGKNGRDALLSTITFFRYKKPFVYLTDQDVRKLLETTSPVLVAGLFRRCMETKNLKPIRESVSPKKYDFADYTERIYYEEKIEEMIESNSSDR